MQVESNLWFVGSTWYRHFFETKLPTELEITMTICLIWMENPTPNGPLGGIPKLPKGKPVATSSKTHRRKKSSRKRKAGGVMGDGLDTIIYLFFRPADQPLSMFVLPSQYFRHSGIPFCNFYELINSKKSVQCVARKSKKNTSRIRRWIVYPVCQPLFGLWTR